MPFDDRENYPYFYRTIGETKLWVSWVGKKLNVNKLSMNLRNRMQSQMQPKLHKFKICNFLEHSPSLDSNRYQQVYEKLLTKWNWKRIFALTEDGMKYTQYITALESRLKQVDPNFWFLNKKFSRDTADKDFENFRNVSWHSSLLQSKIYFLNSKFSETNSICVSWRRRIVQKSSLQMFTITIWWCQSCAPPRNWK